MTIYSILFDKIPFKETTLDRSNSFFALVQVINEGKRPIIEPGKISKSLKQLIRRCWDKNPKIRPTFEEISQELLVEIRRCFEEKEFNEEEMKEIRKFVKDFCKRKEEI